RKEVKQCGRCGSCILRMQAINYAGLQQFERTDYAESPFDGDDQSDQFQLMAYQARQIMDVMSDGSLAEAARLWPELVLGEEDLLSSDVVKRLGLLHRYAVEWRTLVEGNPALGALLRWSFAG